MKKKYVIMGLAATIAIALFAQMQINAMKSASEDENIANENGFMNKMMNHWRDRTINHWRNRERAMNNYLNITRIEGILESIDGKYYVNDVEIYFGDDFFLASTSRSDYDMDGVYETVMEEINGLVGSEVIINGLLEENIIYASHINGMWLRRPCYNELVELEGILEEINGSYYIDDIKLMIKQGFSKSDIDRDGTLERMYDELNGLVGEEIRIDGILKDSGIAVMHINGIWAR